MITYTKDIWGNTVASGFTDADDAWTEANRLEAAFRIGYGFGLVKHPHQTIEGVWTFTYWKGDSCD